MPRTLSQLKSRIAQAMAEADNAESVLKLIREAVRTYGFDAEDIFGRGDPPPPRLRLVAKATAPSKLARQPTTVKVPQAPFADANGNTWSGRGRLPNWLVAELARGASIEQFSTANVRAAAPAGQRRGRQRAQPLPPYMDDKGNAWSGRGRRPNWLNAAIEAGASLEDFSTDGL